MEPVRVKVYGLVPLTRRRYLIQAAFGLVCLAGLLVLWWLYWPELNDRLSKVTRTALAEVVYLTLANTPWILLGVLALKLVEMAFVLRRFACKEAEARRVAAPAPPVSADNG